MKITVENLGTIHKGEISLDKELTIFTGENNSGKSYMSYLVYEIVDLIYVIGESLRRRFIIELEQKKSWHFLENGIGINIEDVVIAYTYHLTIQST
jgi:predicted ATPase